MSRPRYYWNNIVKKMITRYPVLRNESSIQAGLYIWAIESALKETEQLTNGQQRIKAIEDVYFKKTKTCEGVALELNFSNRTVQYWLNDFVNLVGAKAGFN